MIAIAHAGAALCLRPISMRPTDAYTTQASTNQNEFLVFFNEHTCVGHFDFRIPGCNANQTEVMSALGEFHKFAVAKGPDSFHVRVSGTETLSLSVHDFEHVDCRYTTIPFHVKHRGVYTLQAWHLYENYNAFSIDDENFAPYTPGLMTAALAYSVNYSTTYLLPPTHTASVFCHQNNHFTHDISVGHRHREATRPLCDSGGHAPGRWIVHTSNSSSLDFQAATQDNFRSLATVASWEPDACTLPSMETLSSGLTSPNGETLDIYILGDSHFRTLANGFWFALSGTNDTDADIFHHTDMHALKDNNVKYRNGFRIVYCIYTRPDMADFGDCDPGKISSHRAVVITGTAAWPLSTVGTGHVMTPDEYRRNLTSNFLPAWKSWLDESLQRRIYFVSSIAQPMYFSLWLNRTHDHRNNFLNVLYNDIAADVFRGSRIKMFDVFSISLPVNHLSLDRAHYTGAVLRETVRVVMHALLTPSSS